MDDDCKIEKALSLLGAVAVSDDYAELEAEWTFQEFQQSLVTLLSVARAYQRWKKRPARPKENATRAGAAWTEEEQRELVHEYRDDGSPIGWIAKKHERSPFAILNQLFALRLIDDQLRYCDYPTPKSQHAIG